MSPLSDTLIKKDADLDPDLQWALSNYVMDSGRLLVIELDQHGDIRDTNVTFRAQLAAFRHVRGEPLSRFLVSEQDEPPRIESGLSFRTPIPYLLKGANSGELYLFHAYPLRQGILLIGELTNVAQADIDIIERMGHLAIEMSRLVRDLRKTNHELARANELNRRLAHTDPLTGIANRRYFMERLRKSIAHAQARQLELSVLMIDMDHFKRVNDRFGHAGGDAALVAFAQLLAAQIRAGDLPARLGGEEFAVYMPDTGLEAAAESAERLRARAADLRPIDTSHQITASFGVTVLTKGDSAESFLKRADALLYQAKAEGRNRVVVGT